MRRFLPLAAAMLLVGLSEPALAETINLTCGPDANQPGTTQIQIDTSASTVSYPAPGLPAQISADRVTWSAPRQGLPDGNAVLERRFDLSRASGVLRMQYVCVAGDSCTTNEAPPLYCKRTQAVF